MPRFAANLSMMFQEWDFLNRFQAAADVGFQAVEFLFPYDFAADKVASARERAGVEIALFNLPPGDWNAAERGLAALPGRSADFDAAVAKALDYAGPLGARRLHAMAGIPGAVDEEQIAEVYTDNLGRAAEAAAPHGIDILIEPINTRDIPGFWLNDQATAHAIREAVGAANLKVQMDLYHCQIVEGDVATRLRRWLPTGGVGHIQIAGVPERHEPSLGELNHDYLFDVIDELGFEGWIGCEYRPAAGTVDGLGWARRFGIGA